MRFWHRRAAGPPPLAIQRATPGPHLSYVARDVQSLFESLDGGYLPAAPSSPTDDEGGKAAGKSGTFEAPHTKAIPMMTASSAEASSAGKSGLISSATFRVAIEQLDLRLTEEEIVEVEGVACFQGWRSTHQTTPHLQPSQQPTSTAGAAEEEAKAELEEATTALAAAIDGYEDEVAAYQAELDWVPPAEWGWDLSDAEGLQGRGLIIKESAAVAGSEAFEKWLKMFPTMKEAENGIEEAARRREVVAAHKAAAAELAAAGGAIATVRTVFIIPANITRAESHVVRCDV